MQHHNFNWNKIDILDKETNFWKRRISEMIHINLQANTINLYKDSLNLHEPYMSVINKFCK